MLVPLSWLNDYVDINVSADELEKKLFDCGFEVEEKWQVGKDISGIVVGYVESCEPIPETHLHVCQVNVGGPELLQICCGADNVKAGGKEMIENVFNFLQLVFCLGGGLGLIIAVYQLIQSLGARDGAEKSNATLHIAVAAATIGLGLGLGVFESSILKMLGLS